MPLFYRGAGVGTYWHTNDARSTGFVPRFPGMPSSANYLIQHIAQGTVSSPYVSLTRSYGVALTYALIGTHAIATASNPGYVYEVEIDNPLPGGPQILDPIIELAAAVPHPLSTISYQHDGFPGFLLGVVDPQRMRRFLMTPYPQPPGASGTSRTPNLTGTLEAFVRVLRDAEILALGTIPTSCIRHRHNVY